MHYWSDLKQDFDLSDIDYFHNLELAPTKELIDGYRKKEIDWQEYESVFNALLKERKVEDLDPKLFKNACLLCSEDVPHQCHRRLVAEYLKKFWKNQKKGSWKFGLS